MNRMLTATVAATAIAGAAACSVSAAPATDGGRQDLLKQVNSTGWGSRINKDRYPNGYGFSYDGYEPRYAPEAYGNEAGPYGYEYRGPVRAAPYGYGYEPDDGAF